MVSGSTAGFIISYFLNNLSVLHSLLVLCQATTLNVAINSNNKALMTIMMSNNVSQYGIVMNE